MWPETLFLEPIVLVARPTAQVPIFQPWLPSRMQALVLSTSPQSQTLSRGLPLSLGQPQISTVSPNSGDESGDGWVSEPSSHFLPCTPGTNKDGPLIMSTTSYWVIESSHGCQTSSDVTFSFSSLLTNNNICLRSHITVIKAGSFPPSIIILFICLMLFLPSVSSLIILLCTRSEWLFQAIMVFFRAHFDICITVFFRVLFDTRINVFFRLCFKEN